MKRTFCLVVDLLTEPPDLADQLANRIYTLDCVNKHPDDDGVKITELVPSDPHEPDFLVGRLPCDKPLEEIA